MLQSWSSLLSFYSWTCVALSSWLLLIVVIWLWSFWSECWLVPFCGYQATRSKYLLVIWSISCHGYNNTSSSDSSSSSSSLVFKKKRMAVTAILLTGEKQASAITLTVFASFLSYPSEHALSRDNQSTYQTFLWYNSMHTSTPFLADTAFSSLLPVFTDSRMVNM